MVRAVIIAYRHPLDSRRSRAGGTYPIVYSLHNPRGLSSLRIRLSPIYPIPTIVPYNPLSIKSPYNNYLLIDNVDSRVKRLY